MKRIFGLLLLLPFFALAQGKKDSKYTVGPKESLSSIGRMYNINGRELANYNHIDYDKGLTIGQVLNIPAANAATVINPAKITTPIKEIPVKSIAIPTTKGTPIYHIVGKKETLYHISTLYNKVPIVDLKKWNNLTSDGVSEGTKLIVGYLGSKQPQVTDNKVVKAPAIQKDAVEIKKPAETVVAVVPKSVEEKQPVEVKKEEAKTEPVKITTDANKSNTLNGGFFKALYDTQINGNSINSESGAGGIFKSTSGWDDGKYYCLHNTAAVGTVIKVVNIASGKSIYAKVLDLIPDIKQNSGIIIRISNAAAAALGVTGNKLDCTLNYSK
ncbi:MAG: LysM peptidoglycan-binding domain-containing protein [Ferruginibacter sp.]